MAGIEIVFVVAAALVDPDGRVLVQQRPAGKSLAGLWEFPGGKVEAGEPPEVALARELHEELAVDVDPGSLAPFTFASEPLGDRHLLLLLYLCRDWLGVPRPLHATALQWCRPEALDKLPMPPADVPLVRALVEALDR